MYQKEKEQKFLDEETPIEEIFDHKKVFLMACSSAAKNADHDYSITLRQMRSAIQASALGAKCSLHDNTRERQKDLEHEATEDSE